MLSVMSAPAFADRARRELQAERRRRGRAGVRVKTFGKRLGSGEKAGHKRMAEVGVVFDVVSDDSSACGRAARDLAQVVIADVREDPRFAAHREIAANSGFQAVQSTPLVDQDSRLLGMLSTH
jgi:GAF domain-containing protein